MAWFSALVVATLAAAQAPPVVEPLPAEPATAAEAAVPEAPADGKRAVRRIAVYRLEGGGIDDRVLGVLTDSVVLEVRKLVGVTVVGMDEIKAMLDLEAQKQLVGCTDVSCIAEIAEALGVDEIMIGNVAVVGATISFGLKRIDQNSATTLGQYANRVDSTDPADVLALIGPAIEQLLAEVPLKPGQTRGVPPEIATRIHPPPLDPWVFWTVGAGVGTAAIAGMGFTLWNLASYTRAVAQVEDSVAGTAANGKDLNRDVTSVQASFVGLLVSYGVVVLGAAGAGVVALFTDWDDVGGAE
jgi:hypothetical protein